MNQTKGLIGMRQLMALLLLMVGAKLSDDTPALLYSDLHNSAWMAPLIAALEFLFPLFLLLKVQERFKNLTLHEINLTLLGKGIGYVVSLFLWLMGTAAIIVDSRNYTDIISTLYFTKTPTLVVYAVLMFVVSYGAKRGLQNIGSLAWLSLWYIKGTLFLALLLTFQAGTTKAIFPLWGPGKIAILKESSLKVSIFADFVYIFLIAKYAASFKEFKKGTLFAFLFLMFELSLAYLAFEMVFDYPTAQLLNYPFHDTIRYITFGRFLTNIETLFFPFWLLAVFVKFSAYLYLNALLFGSLFKIKHFELVIPTLATLYLIMGMALHPPAFVIFTLRNVLLNVLTPMVLLYPILLWIVAQAKGMFNNERSISKTH